MDWRSTVRPSASLWLELVRTGTVFPSRFSRSVVELEFCAEASCARAWAGTNKQNESDTAQSIFKRIIGNLPHKQPDQRPL